MTEDLRPADCKFCGSDNWSIEVEEDQNKRPYFYAVVCNCCFASGPHAPSLEAAKRLWGLAPRTINANGPDWRNFPGAI